MPEVYRLVLFVHVVQYYLGVLFDRAYELWLLDSHLKLPKIFKDLEGLDC